jgi:hypothetical protein
VPASTGSRRSRSRRATRARRIGVITAVSVVALVAALLALWAIFHTTHTAGQTAGQTAGTSTTTSVPGAKSVPYNKYKNARLDVSLDAPCTHEADGSWVLKGTVINPDPVNPTGFSIVVDFVHVPGDTVLDTQIVTVPPVRPRHTVAWQASWHFAGTGVSCVVRQAQVT